LNNLGIEITGKETVALWKLLKVDSKELNFDGFSKLLNADLSSLRPALPSPPPAVPRPADSPPARALPEPEPEPAVAPPTTPQLPLAPPKAGLLATLSANRRALLHKFGECDPAVSGRISCANFQAICESFQAVGAGSIEEIAAVYDPHLKGHFNYFSLLSDICEHSDPPPTIARAVNRNDHGTGINPDLLMQATYGDSDDESPVTPDPPVLEEETGVSSSRGGGCGKLDPAIFGRRPPPDSPPKFQRQSADAIVGVKPLPNLSVGELLRAIPKFVFKCSKTLKDCYQRWRGMHEFLTAEDMRDGLALDAKVLVPLSGIQALMERYGGPMTVSAFVRMISDGSRSDAPPTEDDSALTTIAARLRGEKWADIVFSSTCVEDIVLRFEQEGIEVSEKEIRLLTSKLGRTGLVSALQARLGK
jgi:hypothetical protein